MNAAFRSQSQGILPFASRRVRQYANSDSGMNSSLEKHSGRGSGAGQCLARSVVDTLAEEPALEAVTIDRAHQKISVATLGRVPQGGIGPADRAHHAGI